MTSPKQIFRLEYGGSKHATTPNVVCMGICREFVYEVAKGTGIYGDVRYGVTVIEFKETPEKVITKRRRDLSYFASDLKEHQDLLEDLLKRIKKNQVKSEIIEDMAII